MIRRRNAKGPILEQHSTHAFLYNEPADTASPKQPGGQGELQSLVYQSMPLSQLPTEDAIAFCKQLYAPEERFAQGFYRYHRDIIGLPEKEAWDATIEELNEYVDRLINNLDDPRNRTVGFDQHGYYTPVGLYGFRALSEHFTGQKLIQTLNDTGLIQHYPGNLAIAHSFSALSGYRNRAFMKYVFLLIALEALENDFQHIFFFMSDYRLGPIYKRYGLEFPPNLTFPDSKHLVGCYRLTPEHLEDIRSTLEQFGHCISTQPNF